MIGSFNVQVEAVFAGNERKRFVEILLQFANSAGFPGIVTCGLDAAAGEGVAGFFKSTPIIALPAMNLEKAVLTTDYTDNTDMEGLGTQALFTRKVNRKAQTDCHNCLYPCYLCNPWLILLPDLG